MSAEFSFGLALFTSSLVFVAWTIANYQDKKKTLLNKGNED